MINPFPQLGWLAVLLTFGLTSLTAEDTSNSAGDRLISDYFAVETAKVTRNCLADIQSIEDWQERRDRYHAELSEMLGLSPWPARTPLQPVVTQSLIRDGVIVENVHFQSMPGLYVTGNLYRPEQQDGQLPAVLYVCGHGRVKKDGISYGNKSHYQHHGAWFAKNGYICLIIDTIQLGEIEGIHHGTYRHGMWWWHNRGYTSAGVEAWNGIRALDYLQSRNEVDGERLGITGRSGGGAYSWWVAALDERIKAAVPVAGITSMQNHVVDNCIEGHCDCMYMTNTFAWDFPLLAAMVAPRALLISNTDKDRIFPLDGVVDVYSKTRRIYELHDALDHIGLNISEGPHKDTQELRVNAFHWLNRFLKNEDPLIEVTATKLFTPEELKVFKELPADERVTTIQESFVPTAQPTLPADQQQLEAFQKTAIAQLQRTAFRNQPIRDFPNTSASASAISWQNSNARLTVVNSYSDNVYQLPVYLLTPIPPQPVKSLRVTVCDQERWERVRNDLIAGFPLFDAAAEQPTTPWEKTATFAKLQSDAKESIAYVMPRGIGPTAWTADERKETHIKRRFALLGQTLDSVRIHDVLQSIQSLKVSHYGPFESIHLEGQQRTADWALFAAIIDSNIDSLYLQDLTCDFRSGPELLQVSQYLTKPGSLLLAANRVKTLQLANAAEQVDCWSNVVDAAKKLNWPQKKLQLK